MCGGEDGSASLLGREGVQQEGSRPRDVSQPAMGSQGTHAPVFLRSSSGIASRGVVVVGGGWCGMKERERMACMHDGRPRPPSLYKAATPRHAGPPQRVGASPRGCRAHHHTRWVGCARVQGHGVSAAHQRTSCGPGATGQGQRRVVIPPRGRGRPPPLASPPRPSVVAAAVQGPRDPAGDVVVGWLGGLV